MTPARLPKTDPFARVLLAGGGITAFPDSREWRAGRRELIAGLAIYGAVAIVALIVVVIATGLAGGKGL